MDLRSIITNIADKYNLQSIGIFGSRSRGDYREDSDYDIFVIGDLALDEELKLESELEELLNYTVDVVKISENTDKLLLKNIVNDAEVIYNKNNSYENLYKFVERFFIENSDFIQIREADLLDQRR
ncbi:nucleotidyltransferase domain-containing protein [Clostridium sp. A1-XYC3]|uniref:Nucleotidyltransferase domain-containing protein n=1 Tax=Clostridium tanneri TaxID=3037988 RepID=A0ABU4JWF4_9CLOT|nr:nucleotidyltransferase domain-containing protein [Clostridium sp. A1-XYC3]MDW8802483.1 nucleotidyltransferase domain-containing protein [Clostridium sp. A1-XYC3]